MKFPNEDACLCVHVCMKCVYVYIHYVFGCLCVCVHSSSGGTTNSSGWMHKPVLATMLNTSAVYPLLTLVGNCEISPKHLNLSKLYSGDTSIINSECQKRNGQGIEKIVFRSLTRSLGNYHRHLSLTLSHLHFNRNTCKL